MIGVQICALDVMLCAYKMLKSNKGRVKKLKRQKEIAFCSDILGNLQEAELHFASSLAALVRGINSGVEFHGDLSGIGFNPAELITGRFTGFKVHFIFFLL